MKWPNEDDFYDALPAVFLTAAFVFLFVFFIILYRSA